MLQLPYVYDGNTAVSPIGMLLDISAFLLVYLLKHGLLVREIC